MSVSYAQILKDVQSRMGGRANASSSDQYVSAINEAQSELWKALISVSEDYFLQSTTTTGLTNTFAALNTSTREYTLPADFLRPRFIEVLAPSGYERVQFKYRKVTHPDFIQQRIDSTAIGPTSSSSFLSDFQDSYFFSVIAKNTFILARYPEQPFTLKLWYIRALPMLMPGGKIDETVDPFVGEIVTFATKRLQSINDPGSFAIWAEAWVNGIRATLQTASPRESSPQYSADAEY